MGEKREQNKTLKATQTMGLYLIPPNWALENGWNGNLTLNNFTTAKNVFFFFFLKLLKEE